MLGEWVINDSFLLVGPQHLYHKHDEEEFGYIYVQIKYLPLNQSDDGIQAPVNVDIQEIIRREQELIRGILKINVLHGKDLVMENVPYNDIDSFVSLRIPKLSEKKSKTMSVEEQDAELEKLYQQVEEEIEERQRYLESIAHLDEPKLKERIKAEIIERISELEKIIRMLHKNHLLDA